MKDIPKDIDFYVWFTQNWLIHGGLISKATAARMLNLTNGRVVQMVNEKKLQEIRYNASVVFLSMAEVMKLVQVHVMETSTQKAQIEFEKMQKDGILKPEDIESLKLLTKKCLEAGIILPEK
jgi:hypothetical protein